MWPDGLYTPPSEEAMRSDLIVAKLSGFNMIRKPAKVEPQLWYDLCDTIGLLVWQEIPAGNNNHSSSTAQFGTELETIVRQLNNHPSVVCWVLFQQGIGEHNPGFYADKIRQLDPSRLLCVSSGSDSQPFGNVFDVFAMPELQPMAYQTHQAQTIGRFGGIDLYVKDHSWSTDHWGYGEVSKTTELLAEFQRLTDTIVEYRDRFDVAAAVYHQLIDLEEETNGLMTYDRERMIVAPNDIKEQLEKLDSESRAVSYRQPH
jgi:beta-galactosidase/beta-glucuronidase